MVSAWGVWACEQLCWEQRSECFYLEVVSQALWDRKRWTFELGKRPEVIPAFQSPSKISDKAVQANGARDGGDARKGDTKSERFEIDDTDLTPACLTPPFPNYCKPHDAFQHVASVPGASLSYPPPPLDARNRRLTFARSKFLELFLLCVLSIRESKVLKHTLRQWVDYHNINII